jgi:hypothetical protein
MSNYYDKNSSPMAALAYAARNARKAEQLDGRRIFPTTAIVVENADPEYRRRIKIADPAYSGKVTSNWILPIRVTENSDPPLPKVSQLVMVFYADGDPEKGYYLPLMPDTNPSRDKENPVNDHSERIDGNRDVVVGGSENLVTENSQDNLVGGEYKLSVAGDISTHTESAINTRANEHIDISCGVSVTLRTDSGAFISLTSSGFVLIQDAQGRKITLGGLGDNGQWDLNGYSLELLNASNVTIAGKSICTIGATDSRGDTLVTRGW